jgi:tRNA threonylcarbamoyladenosine biosynthesis protein TsaE
MAVGAQLAEALQPGDIVCLYGDLGAGKTTFIKGIAGALGIKPTKVSSPTFVLMNAYNGRLPLYHFDLYRLESADVLGIGYDEFFYGQGVALVEWPERLGALQPDAYWKIMLAHEAENRRAITIDYHGEHASRRLKVLLRNLNGMSA